MAYRHIAWIVLMVLVCAAPAWAQGERVWVDVNVAAAIPGEESLARAPLSFPLHRETATFTGEYRTPSASLFDIGGGLMITSRLGAGLSVSRARHTESPVIAARLPHPVFFNNYASTSRSDGLSELERRTTRLDFSGLVSLLDTPRVRVRAFGGPTYFRARQELIGNVHWTEEWSTTSPTPHNVAIERFETLRADDSGWGAHVGADVSTFFISRVGLGAFLKYHVGGTLETTDIFSPTDQDVETFDLKALSVGGGVRFRF